MIEEKFKNYLIQKGYSLIDQKPKLHGYGFEIFATDLLGKKYFVKVIEEYPPNESYVPRKDIEGKIEDVVRIKGNSDSEFRFAIVVPDKQVYKEVLKQNAPLWISGTIDVFLIGNNDVIDLHLESIKGIDSNTENGFIF